MKMQKIYNWRPNRLEFENFAWLLPDLLKWVLHVQLYHFLLFQPIKSLVCGAVVVFAVVVYPFTVSSVLRY